MTKKSIISKEQSGQTIRDTRSPINKFREEMTELLNNVIGDFDLSSSLFPRTLAGQEEHTVIPNIDISEDEQSYVIKAELPGVEEKDINVSIKNGILAIQGEKREEKEKKYQRYYSKECMYGTFNQTIALPDAINENDIHASFKNGMLSITVPKNITNGTEAKKIELKSS